MRIFYDFHVHSDLSPCAESTMTPYNVVGMAYIKGLNCMAVADHNHIGNVRVAMEQGEKLGVTVVPAMELQTAEDIHILCLFYAIEELENFYKVVKFPFIMNDEKIWGEQNLYNAEDEIIGKESRLLIASSTLNVYEAIELVHAHGGLVIPAHIDRESNGILSILGMIDSSMRFDALEFSNRASEKIIAAYNGSYGIIKDSDAHTLENLSEPENWIDVENCSVKNILDAIKRLKPN